MVRLPKSTFLITTHDYFDQELPDSIRNGQRITTMTGGQKRFLASKFKFDRCGQSGIEMSELVLHEDIADEIAMVHSVTQKQSTALTCLCHDRE